MVTLSHIDDHTAGDKGVGPSHGYSLKSRGCGAVEAGVSAKNRAEESHARCGGR